MQNCQQGHWTFIAVNFSGLGLRFLKIWAWGTRVLNSESLVIILTCYWYIIPLNLTLSALFESNCYSLGLKTPRICGLLKALFLLPWGTFVLVGNKLEILINCKTCSLYKISTTLYNWYCGRSTELRLKT